MTLRDLGSQTTQTYDTHGAAFDAQRNKSLFERAWIERLLALVPDGGTILDLGCGSGQPIANYLIGRGYDVTGFDASRTLIDLCAKRFPNATWHIGDMRHLDLGQTFDAIIAWDSFFHLTQDDQRRTLPRILDHLGAKGALLVTVGHAAGEVTGQINGELVYHASLDPDEYASILAQNGARLRAFVAEDPECTGHSVLLACKHL